MELQLRRLRSLTGAALRSLVCAGAASHQAQHVKAVCPVRVFQHGRANAVFSNE